MSEGGGADHTIVAGPLQLRVTASGVLRVGWDEPDWLGPGRLVVAGNRGDADGRDGMPRVDGSAGGICVDAGWVRAHVLALDAEPVAVLRLEAISPSPEAYADGFANPCVAWHFDPGARAPGGAPQGMRGFGHQYTEFALPVFSDAALSRWRLLPFRPPVVLPLGLVAPDGRTILLAPLRGFHEQVVTVPAGRETAGAGLRAGWHGDVGALAAGHETELAVIAGRGARECFDIWGRLLRSASGVAPPRRDSGVLATRVSYWTDNGSAYWYRTEPGHGGVASSIVAAVDDLEARGLPVGAVQLDSWWYPHETLRPFDTDDTVVPPTGMVRWEPRPDVLPDGVTGLREQLGRRPLVTHCRHLSSQSPYVGEFPMWADGDRAHPQTPELYERLLDQAVGWGVEVFEHDWLVECFLGVAGLRGAGRAAAWQEGLDAALHARGIDAQWCMASPADFAEASRLRAVTSIRTSGDHGYLVGPEMLWAWFLHVNVMARALGLWPYKDVFRAAPGAAGREVEALLAALSGGPVGVGDPVGAADVALVRRTCRADGVLVRPDVPVAAIDRAAFEAPVWSGQLLAGSAHTGHAAGRWGYVVTCNVGADRKAARARVALADLGDDCPATSEIAVYDWRRGRIDLLEAGATYDVELEPLGWDYRVLAPVPPCGIAVVGDPSLYASAGDARLATVESADSDACVRLTVLGAGERVPLTGWSRGALSARAWSPAAGASELDVAHDPASGRWDLELDVAPNGWTRVELRPVT